MIHNGTHPETSAEKILDKCVDGLIRDVVVGKPTERLIRPRLFVVLEPPGYGGDWIATAYSTHARAMHDPSVEDKPGTVIVEIPGERLHGSNGDDGAPERFSESEGPMAGGAD